MKTKRETFTTHFGLLMSMIGVAVGLGAVWRFPYMVGMFGGSAFVLFYLAVILLIGIPALAAEWVLGQHTQRGTLGAYQRGGLPGGRFVGMFFFGIVFIACGYYTNAVGWVGFHGVCELLRGVGVSLSASAILPPEQGWDGTSLLLQLVMSGLVIGTCALVIIRGLRRGIERVSRWLVPGLFIVLVILIIRSVTLPGAMRGLHWYLGGFQLSALKPSVMAAAMGMAFFSLSLGGTFMVIYGSYLDPKTAVLKNAILTGIGALLAGLLAGLAIFPAVFAFNLTPESGPGLIFSTLPKTFAQMPLGWIFGFLFYASLFGAAFLSDVAAFEVMVGGLVDNTKLSRKKASLICCVVVFGLAIPPMINYKIFVPWDLIFGSGVQVLGSLMTVLTVGWCIGRSSVLKRIAQENDRPFYKILFGWIRFGIPSAILLVGLNWFIQSVLNFH